MNREMPNVENKEPENFKQKIIKLNTILDFMPEGLGDSPVRDTLNKDCLTAASTIVTLLKDFPDSEDEQVSNFKHTMLNTCENKLKTIKYKSDGVFKGSATDEVEEAIEILKELKNL